MERKSEGVDVLAVMKAAESAEFLRMNFREHDAMREASAAVAELIEERDRYRRTLEVIASIEPEPTKRNRIRGALTHAKSIAAAALARVGASA